MGSLLSAVYAHSLVVPEAAAAAALPPTVRDSLDEALLASERMPLDAAQSLVQAASAAFDKGFAAVLLLATLLPVSYTHLDVYKRQSRARASTSITSPAGVRCTERPMRWNSASPRSASSRPMAMLLSLIHI